MTNLEIEGRIVRKMAVQSGQSARGSWARQDFILEYQDGNFPAQACFSAWGEDKVRDLDRFQVGDSVKVAFNIRSREYNDRWYNDLRVWRLSPVGGGAAPAAEAPSVADVPASAPAPTLEDMPAFTDADGNDDLPF